MYAVIMLGLLLCILINERQNKEKIRKLEETTEWQRTKYERWRDYLNKGYQIANTS